MTTEFFMPMIPPTVTHQEKRIKVVNGKPIVYEPAALKDAREKLRVYLLRFKPTSGMPYNRAVRLVCKWCFPLPVRGKHTDGEYRVTKPDTDNLQKLLKDVMTDCGYWTDDAIVASEICEKFWAIIPGIYIRIENIGGRCPKAERIEK